MLTAKQTIEAEQHVIKPLEVHEPQTYAPPKLEKMQKLAQVTGGVALTGVT